MTASNFIGKYKIIQEIGYGGFAVVYKAYDTEAERMVALKVMHPYWRNDESFVKRFHREGDLMAQLQHPAIVTVYESGSVDEDLYIAMEYLPGETLSQWLKKTTHLPLAQAVVILEQVAAALDYAHQQGMIHRDIKPANIILQKHDDSIRVTLLDFGLVKALAGSSALTSHGMLVGSPEYMSPEQANLERRQEVGTGADRYALGVLAYRVLTGRVPFPGNTPATLNAHEHKPVPDPRELRPDLPAEVAAALCKMLAKDVAERFPTGRDFVAQLRVFSDTQTNRQQRDSEVQTLYARLDVAARGRQWREVLSLATEIQTLDRHYRDVQVRIDSARRALDIQLTTSTHRLWRGRAAMLFAVLGTLFLSAWALGWFSSQPAPPRNPETGNIWLRPIDDMTMVYVPPGTLLMGKADGDVDEKPVHPVVLSGFWLDQTEVTLAQYARCVADNVCPAATLESSNLQYPVTGISWETATAYCAWGNARLPTEAEWEYAYRGPQSRLYPWGATFEATRVNFCDAACVEDWAAVATDGYAEAAPVGTFPAGATWCGARDMAGNVWEWVADWYGASYYVVSGSQNPLGPPSGSQRVLRGGSWRSDAGSVRGSYRFSAVPTATAVTWGFRCAWSEE